MGRWPRASDASNLTLTSQLLHPLCSLCPLGLLSFTPGLSTDIWRNTLKGTQWEKNLYAFPFQVRFHLFLPHTKRVGINTSCGDERNPSPLSLGRVEGGGPCAGLRGLERILLSRVLGSEVPLGPC